MSLTSSNARLRRTFARTLLLPAAAMLVAALTAPAHGQDRTEWAGSHPLVLPAESRGTRVPDPFGAALRRVTPTHVTGDAGPAGNWSLVGPPSGAARYAQSIVYDTARQQLVSFGGGDSIYTGFSLLRNETWVFSLSTGVWTRLSTAGTPPSPRLFHSAIYDAAGDRMIVFGGADNGQLDGDVHQLTLAGTPTWSTLSPSGPAPGARAGALAVYDAAQSRMLLYGGLSLSGDSAYVLGNDVWALSLGASPAWNALAPTGVPPTATFGACAGFDAVSNSLYLFGGEGEATGFSNQISKLSLSGTPAWVPVVTSGAPPPRAFAAGGFDPVSHRFAVSCGQSYTIVETDSFPTMVPTTYADVWTVDPAAGSPTWQDVTPDPTILPRWGSAGIVSAAGQLYVAGGLSDHYRPLNDVWKLDVGAPAAWHTWDNLYPYRLQEVMVHDTNRHRLIAFGGTDGSYRNDTYVRGLASGRGWSPLVTAGTPPSGRRLHTGIYDPVGDRLIVFGGYDDAFHNDLWQLSFAGATPTWSPIAATGGGPSVRAGHVAAYDPVGQRMIVYGGYDGATLPSYRVRDTWSLSLGAAPGWTRLADGPTGRSSATMVYDDASRSMIVFGGTSPAFLNESWALSLDGTPAWSLVAAGVPPAAREEHSAVYDVARDRMVIFGGYDTPTPGSHNYNDLWSLGFAGTADWHSLLPSGDVPTPRWGMKAVYDPDQDGMWMYGGWDNFVGYQQQLWFLQWVAPTVPWTISATASQVTSASARITFGLPEKPRAGLRIQRSTNGTTWSRVGLALPFGLSLPYRDRAVVPGGHYAYRALYAAGGRAMRSAPVWVTIPGATDVPAGALAFSLANAGTSVRPGTVALRFVLPSRGAARLALIDVAGRVLDSRDLSEFGPGEFVLDLGRDLAPGVFFARLTSGARVATLKSVVLR